MSFEIAPIRMEPARIEEMSAQLADLSTELAVQVAQLAGRMPPRTIADMADMVRLMNSYYSNRIEGNNTSPRDIELALAGNFDDDPEKRAIQQENAAHIGLQSNIDKLAQSGLLPDPSGQEFIQTLHRQFYQNATPYDLSVKDDIYIFPGAWRVHDVKVGVHVPPPFDKVPAFMAHFHERFRLDRMKGRTERILGMATAHHRFAWIHPFQDGNGRVSRLMSHAMAHHAGIGAGGLWSVSRGLARGLEGGLTGRDEYKSMMAMAYRTRQGDRDGRGNLSLAALVSFATWFLKVCLDQVQFMRGLYDLTALEDRLLRYAGIHELRSGAAPVLRAVLALGEVPRGAVPVIIGASDSTAQRLIRELVENGILGSDTAKGPLSLRFGSVTHDILFPRLFDF